MPNPNVHHRERLKRRFLETGLRGFAPHNALELLLFFAIPRADVNILAHTLIDRFGSLAAVFDASTEELITVRGVSYHTATLIKLIPAMSVLYRTEKSGADFSFSDLDRVRSFLSEYFSAATSEHSVLLIFNDSGSYAGLRELSGGNAVAAEFAVRRIVELTLSARGRKIIIAHNHCTSDATPSVSDIRLTGELRRTLSAIDIDLVEHIVVSRSGATLPLIDWAKSSPDTARLLHGV